MASLGVSSRQALIQFPGQDISWRFQPCSFCCAFSFWLCALFCLRPCWQQLGWHSVQQQARLLETQWVRQSVRPRVQASAQTHSLKTRGHWC